MDEVTVVSTGYQNVKPERYGGSYTTVKAEDIMMPAYANIDQMLPGTSTGNDGVEFQYSCRGFS